MRKFVSYFFALASSAAFFAGCTKEINNQEPNTTGTHEVTFVSDQIDTKTQVVEGNTEASYIWNSGDAQYLHVYENGIEATDKSLSLDATGSVGTISATFNNTSATTFVYKAYYYSEKTNTGNPKVLEVQNPKANSFDPKTDVLISDETTAGPAQSELKLRFGRVAVVSKMTLKGMTAGEVVSKVTLTGSAALNGSYAEASTNQETGDPIAAHWNAGTKKLVFESFENATVDENGEFPIYFVSIPFEGTISISVTTDQNQYDRDDITTTLKFEVGKMARFGLKLKGYGAPIETGATYSAVNSIDDLYDGATYIIVGSDVNYAVGLFTGGNNHPAVAIEKSVNDQNKSIITIDNTVAVEPVLLNKVGSNWTIKNNASGNSYYGQYLICATGKNNRLQETDSESSSLKEWTISISEGVATIINANSDAQRTQVYYNQNTGNSPIFACYEPGQTNTNYHTIALYVDLNTCTPVLATPNVLAEVQNNNEIYVTWDEVANADGYIVTCTGKADQNVATGVGEATFTALADGTYTITVTAISNDHSAYLDSKPATVEDILVGSPKGTVENPYTVAEVIASIDGGNTDACYITGTISSVQYYYDASHATATYFISDDGTTTSAQFEAYSVKFLENKQWAAGNSQIAVGDDVVIYAGGLQIYQETTYETTTNSGSYLYSLNGVTSETVPTITKTDISGISADGISNATATVTFANADGWDVAVTPDGTIVTAASISGNTITYSVGANDGNARTGSITVTLTKNGRTDVSAVINVAQDANSSSTGTHHTSTLSFTDKCNGSGTADDNVSWTVTSDGSESNFDNTKGIHYGTGSAQVQYIKLSTSGISGTITSVVVNASTASGVSATVDVTVGGSAFGGDAQSLSTTAKDYTFNGSASGDILVTVTKPSKATKALYVKSVVVNYTN